MDTCLLHKGQNVSFGVGFTPNVDEDSLKMLVYGHVGGIDIPFPINNPDACKGSNVTCPVKSGQTYFYSNVIYVKKLYPSMQLVVKLKLVNSKGEVLVCVVIPVQITSSSEDNHVLRFQHHQK
jgi:Niemann-Pick C2 protein